MGGGRDGEGERQGEPAAPDRGPGAPASGQHRLGDLMSDRYRALMEEVRERDAREPDPPNDIDTDHRLRDEGLLAEGGLGVFLSGPDGEPAVNSWAADRLLARAAAAHKLPWGSPTSWPRPGRSSCRSSPSPTRAGPMLQSSIRRRWATWW